MKFTVEKVTDKNLDTLVSLFGEYRKFYEKAPQPENEKRFIGERYKKQDSYICVAITESSQVIGFAQCYFTFSSLSMCNVLVLNDLYVNPDYRNMKVGKEIIHHVIEYCRKNDFKGITLETAESNSVARKIYENLGFTKDDSYLHYYLVVS
ncbi:GNAT family N-acetyltransferase [Leptospira weilii]|uniref:GNAT family N-acetyltransferase n=1 Tax=Leptospira weilii TaxID=28184 RepID=UPI00202327D0|nr:GNAT family N-acetyltransferase [Leptospira weilii]MCL8268501.1 GNAT family N-acetyltransferase [Leptospira weilii]